MHICWLSIFLVIISAVFISASPYNSQSIHPDLINRDDRHHHHKGAPLFEIDEAKVLSNHAPTPPSYYTVDWEDQGHTSRHGRLMVFHGIFMSLAFFVSWPLGIALRSAKHAAHAIATLSFYVLCVLGCAASALYRKSTPNMYEHAVHRSQGYFVIVFAISLSTLDILAAIRRSVTFFRGSNKSFKTFWTLVVKGDHPGEAGVEYISLMEDSEEIDSSKVSRNSMELQHVRMSDEGHCNQWLKHQRHFSTASERTVFDAQSPSNHSDETLHDLRSHHSRVGLLSRMGRLLSAVLERALVFAGYSQFILGIVTYTGGCRQNYLNGCLAHLIKGSIFWCYGLTTFGRFLGAFADIGWAWNRSPSPGAYSAEFVESLLVFTYGITNTWMERFGAHPGDPYTTRQIQHISIAVMFWFAGLIGMGIESKMVRNWLTSSAVSRMPKEAVEEPQSYCASFNPFPALVIGVTGAAMAAHAQTYLFQVQIHMLWGNLLVSFAVLRCLTYFFLWLGPPKSILPSRPPTEALGSFFLACGGLVFMFSTEEVTHAAMRKGRDDVMMFLNVAVALTCFAFCWTFCMVGFNAWLRSRAVSTTNHRNSA